jgi:hypothetical protein
MTAAGIWSLRLCEVDVTDGRIQDGLKWLANNEDCSFDDNPGHPYDQPHCFLYYYYMTVAKALTMCFLHDLGGVDWYAALSTKLITLQLEDGHWVNAPASHGWEDMPELATVYALLALQVKQPPPAKLWMSIILASNAELCVYDPQGRHARLNDVTIPGATFEIDEEGRQVVNLTELEAGKYTVELAGIADGDYSLTINGHRNEEQTFSKTFVGTIKKGQILVGSALVTSMVGALTIYTEKPMPPSDTIPPTTILAIGEPKYIKEITYVTSDTPFNLTAIDNPDGSGVALIAYKIKNATYDSGWLIYTKPFYLTELSDGTYQIDYNSTDYAGNIEPSNALKIILDNTPPITTLTIGEPKYAYDITYVTPDTPFVLEAEDAGAGVNATNYRIYNSTYDSGWMTYTGPFNLISLADGIYTIEYYTIDNVQNAEAAHAINVTLFSWSYVFEDTYGRGTILKINLAHKFFQFITPDKDYGIRKATYMRQCGRAIIIHYYDDELRLITTAVDTKLDFCVAIAWDQQTGKRYFLIDKAGKE